ncbi:hypothetical protein GCM10027321_36420 [Massilia terrae]
MSPDELFRMEPKVLQFGEHKLSGCEHRPHLIDVGYRLATLVYKLIFLQIGYKGKFSDYGAHDRPARDFIADLALISSAAGLAPSGPVAGPAPAAIAPASSTAHTSAAAPRPPTTSDA